MAGIITSGECLVPLWTTVIKLLSVYCSQHLQWLLCESLALLLCGIQIDSAWQLVPLLGHMF